jgi:neutral ceramidase
MARFERSLGLWLCVAAMLGAACDGAGPADGGVDAYRPDTGPTPIPTLDHCSFVEAPPTARAGTTVEAGPVTAGTAEALLDVPLGASLAAFTSRSEGAGGQGFVPEPQDQRRTYLAGSFAPSVGIETAPRIRALALTAGAETVLLMKLDLATSYQGFVHDLEAELGPEFSGKILIATSHSHSSFGNYSGHSALAVGFGRWRSSVYQPIIAQMAEVARAALAARQPARIGLAYDPEFDRDDRVNRDRREENDELAGGREDDHHLFVLRVDAIDGEGTRPIAIVPVFGIHGTLHDAVNAIVSTDAPGGIERVLEERFDTPVLAMHLQGAAGDVSPAGRGSIDCGGMEVCSDFAKAETVGHFAADAILAAWATAGENMLGEVAMEMLSRTVPLGPDYRTFRIRDGALEYAEWHLNRRADGVVWDEDGNLVSPIDEFNAPFGAALCSPTVPALVPRAQMPGTENLLDVPYRGCNRLEHVDTLFETLIDIELEETPLCETTQTTVSALRIGDWMIGTMPGEATTLLTRHLRTLSPVAPERTIIVGYAQDHGGYLLRPEDWLQGGYEPTISFWGPLEGEYVAEQVAVLMAAATTGERENGNADGLAHVASPTHRDEFERDVLATTPGTVPATLPPYILTRLLRSVSSAQPAASVRRLESVFFTWAGEDPMDGTPRVFLQREAEPGVFEDVLRRIGRPVNDGDLILTWTPNPIEPAPGTPRTHYYTVEMQAVAPLGMRGLPTLGDRVGLPLGRYRFRVEGTGYEVASEPFEVTPAVLQAERAAEGAAVRIALRYPAPTTGYRLLDLETLSNAPVPLRSAPVTVVELRGGVPDRTVELATDANGVVVHTPAEGVSALRVTDRFGNGVDVTL